MVSGKPKRWRVTAHLIRELRLLRKSNRNMIFKGADIAKRLNLRCPESASMLMRNVKGVMRNPDGTYQFVPRVAVRW